MPEDLYYITNKAEEEKLAEQAKKECEDPEASQEEKAEEEEEEQEVSETQILEPLYMILEMAAKGMEISDMQDPMLATEINKRRIRSMKRKSMKIAYYVITELYQHCFGDPTTPEEPQEKN